VVSALVEPALNPLTSALSRLAQIGPIDISFGRAQGPIRLEIVVRQWLIRLQAAPDNQAGFLLLQALLGRLPSQELLKSFCRRIRVFSVEENLQWLSSAVAASAGASAQMPSRLVSGAWVAVGGQAVAAETLSQAISVACVEGSGSNVGVIQASWSGGSPELVEFSDQGERTSLLLGSPKLIFFDWSLSIEQSQAVAAMKLVPEGEIWLVVASIEVDQQNTWPAQTSNAHERFMAWRALSVVTGIIAARGQDLSHWHNVRSIYEPQGIPKFEERFL
jgi:hypothetical protein